MKKTDQLASSQSGVTILETAMVLIIAALLILAGLRQYQSYQKDSNLQILQDNVKQLLAGLGNFYYANCYPRTTVLPGLPVTLDGRLVIHKGDILPPTPISVTVNDLLDSGYLEKAPPSTSFMTYNSYSLQFNYYSSEAKVAVQSPTPRNIVIGLNVIWKPQVAVQLPAVVTPRERQRYLAILLGDCLSSCSVPVAPGAGRCPGFVYPCSAGAPGDYVVWERLPSESISVERTAYWLTNPQVRLFRQMYTKPAMPPVEAINPNDGPYFFCGG